MMKVLVAGATGATGKLLVEQLLAMGQHVKVIVRPSGNIPNTWHDNEKVTIIKANIAEIQTDEMAGYLEDCLAAASCLGHNLNLKGLYGKPRRLVTDAVKLLCDAFEMNHPEQPARLVLMNTTGNRNKDLDEPVSFGQQLVIGLVRVLLPPQIDNEKAANYLRAGIGQDNKQIEWVAVRPDSLINEENVSDYKVYPSPVRSAVFNPGKTSRINVGNFMARLITEQELWNQWKGQMPVVYNS